MSNSGNGNGIFGWFGGLANSGPWQQPVLSQQNMQQQFNQHTQQQAAVQGGLYVIQAQQIGQPPWIGNNVYVLTPEEYTFIEEFRKKKLTKLAGG